MSDFSIFDGLIEGVQVISEDLRYLYLNNSVKAQAGLSERDVIGKKCEEVFPGIEQSNAFVNIGKCMDTGQPLTLLNTFEFPDGTKGYFDLRMNRIPEGVLVFSMDQTESKRKEEIIQMAYERYETITSATGSALFEWNLEEEIIFGNSLFVSVCNQFKGKPCLTLSEVLAIGEKESNEHFRELLHQTIENKGLNFTTQLEQYHPNTGLVAFQLNVSISYDANGQPLGFIGYMLDITETTLNFRIKELNTSFNNMFLSNMSLDDCLLNVSKQIIAFSKEFIIGEFWLPNYEQTTLKRRTYFSLIEEENLERSLIEIDEFQFNEGLPGICASKKENVWWNSLEKNTSFIRKKMIIEMGLKTGVAIPLLSNDKLVAVLVLFSKNEIQKRKDQLNLIKNLSENIGYGIMSKRIAHQRDLLNDSDVMILLNLTRKGKIIQMNPTATKMFLPTSLPESKFDIFALIDQKDRSKFKIKWQKLLDDTIKMINTDINIQSSSGKKVSLKVNVTKCADDDTIYLVGLDITKEVELLELLSLFNDLASIGFWSIDLSTWESILSENTKKILKITEDGQVGDSYGKFLKRLIPEEHYNSTIEKLLNEATTIDIHWEHQTEDGLKNIRLIAQSEFKNQTCVRISGVVQDITFLVHTEQELDLALHNYIDLFNQNPIPTWIYDPITFKFILVNNKACELYGYTLEEYLQLSILDIRPKSEHELILNAKKTIIELGQKTFIGNFRHIKKNGEILLMDIFARTIDFQGEKRVLVMGVDRTENMLLQKEISERIIQAEESQREEISRELHDNVCQLLTAAKLYLSMNDEEGNANTIYSKLAMDLIENANKETRQLSHSLSSQNFKDQEFESSIQQVVNSLNTNNAIAVKIQLDDDFLNKIYFGELKLNLVRILQESLTNIYKYSKATEIEIIGNVQSNTLNFSIKDNGIGFDTENVQKGIGLFNIHKRVEVFNGQSEIKSALGKGTEVNIKIPLSDETIVLK
jgi:PAS domain S-box-containing protein